jgi:hypothetical protein
MKWMICVVCRGDKRSIVMCYSDIFLSQIQTILSQSS